MKPRRVYSAAGLVIVVFMGCLGYPGPVFAAERFTLTTLVASNEGSEFDLVNDAYRDQIIRLFSYTAYKQMNQEAVSLDPGIAREIPLHGGYTLYLKLISASNHQDRVHALIKKDDLEYVDTVLAVEKPGVVFLGGPKVSEGDLIIVLEMGF
ncbi:MAG: hypothetical protein FGM27_00675 [Candidatus Omnitrophica bacterium]|nr:hypothetical protein [Candidatus Omnitrophota bacterium]